MDKILERSNGSSSIKIMNNDIKKIYQSGCSKILNPNSYNDNTEIVLINTAGGITCNDKINTEVQLKIQIKYLYSSSRKIYHGIGDPAKVEINISLKNSNLIGCQKN